MTPRTFDPTPQGTAGAVTDGEDHSREGTMSETRRRPLCHIENCRKWTLRSKCVACWRVVCPDHTVLVPETTPGVYGTTPYCVICARDLGLLNVGVPPRDLRMVP